MTLADTVGVLAASYRTILRPHDLAVENAIKSGVLVYIPAPIEPTAAMLTSMAQRLIGAFAHGVTDVWVDNVF